MIKPEISVNNGTAKALTSSVKVLSIYTELLTGQNNGQLPVLYPKVGGTRTLPGILVMVLETEMSKAFA